MTGQPAVQDRVEWNPAPRVWKPGTVLLPIPGSGEAIIQLDDGKELVRVRVKHLRRAAA